MALYHAENAIAKLRTPEVHKDKAEIEKRFREDIAKRPTPKGGHMLIQPVIAVDGDTAKGYWTMLHFFYDTELTGRQVLDYHGRLYGQGTRQRRDEIAELLALVELEDAADRRVSAYSGGMKRRLELARGLMTEPQLFFLDEPTLGLDPQNRANIWDYIRNLKE